MRVLVIDNYDSFTYNLVQYLGELGAEIEVVRNDHATVDELLVRGYDRVIVSPGPCTPTEAGISLDAVRRFPEAKVPTLGVCLGHQALVQAWGGRVVQHEPVHGKTTTIEHDGRTIFRGLRQPLEVGRYHSELAGLARTMRAMAARVAVSSDDLLDTAGTGGGRRTFNVSTTAALIAAGAGCTVAKHGNRSATGLSGSADVLEALGARIDLAPQAVAECIEDVGFGFMFAPSHHQATRYVVPVRRELAVRTIFNFLGPLTNPAGATRQLIGVSDPGYLDVMAGALAVLGTKHALLVSSEDGLDEVSISAPTTVVEVRGEEVTQYTVDPQ